MFRLLLATPKQPLTNRGHIRLFSQQHLPDQEAASAAKEANSQNQTPKEELNKIQSNAGLIPSAEYSIFRSSEYTNTTGSGDIEYPEPKKESSAVYDHWGPYY